MPYICALGPFRTRREVDGVETVLMISDSGKDHVTISYSIAPFGVEVDELEYWPNDVEIEVIGRTMFGEDENIPVYLVKFVDSTVDMTIKKFHDKTEDRTGETMVPSSYRPHITAKHVGEALSIGQRLTATRVFIKEVGDGQIRYARNLI